MLRNDLVKHPPPDATVSKAALTKAKADLSAEPLEPFTEEELKEVHVHIQCKGRAKFTALVLHLQCRLASCTCQEQM